MRVLHSSNVDVWLVCAPLWVRLKDCELHVCVECHCVLGGLAPQTLVCLRGFQVACFELCHWQKPCKRIKRTHARRGWVGGVM